MALCLVFCFASCGETDEDVTGSVTEVTKEESKTEKTEDEDVGEFDIGKVTNNVYKNDFLNLTATFDSDWTFYSEKEIMELNNAASEYLDDETKKQIENSEVVYDMYAQNTVTGGTVNINLQNLKIAGITFDADTVISSIKSEIKTAFENAGFTDIEMKEEKFKFAGKNCSSLVLTAKLDNNTLYERCICYKKGNYCVNISAASVEHDQVDEVFGYFKPIK